MSQDYFYDYKNSDIFIDFNTKKLNKFLTSFVHYLNEDGSPMGHEYCDDSEILTQTMTLSKISGKKAFPGAKILDCHYFYAIGSNAAYPYSGLKYSKVSGYNTSKYGFYVINAMVPQKDGSAVVKKFVIAPDSIAYETNKQEPIYFDSADKNNQNPVVPIELIASYLSNQPEDMEHVLFEYYDDEKFKFVFDQIKARLNKKFLLAQASKDEPDYKFFENTYKEFYNQLKAKEKIHNQFYAGKSLMVLNTPQMIPTAPEKSKPQYGE